MFILIFWTRLDALALCRPWDKFRVLYPVDDWIRSRGVFAEKSTHGPCLEDLLIYMGPNDWFTDNSNGVRPIKSIILGMYNPWDEPLWRLGQIPCSSLSWLHEGQAGSTMIKERPCSTSHHPDFWAPWFLPIVMERVRQNPWDVFCGSVMISIHYQLCVLLRPERDGQVVKFDKVCAQDGVLVPSPVTTV